MRQGSSPLSRGILWSTINVRPSDGIIPALAGNTCIPRKNNKKGSDHPRSRGEYLPIPDGADLDRGSSPLSRGIPGRPDQAVTGARIIPALAGNTGPVQFRPSARPDHPRSRGEYKATTWPQKIVTGSSPLSRGIQRALGLKIALKRIIPALAGNTIAW